MSFVLITGGAGYIGSHICKVFYDEGFIPVTFDNLSKGNKWAIKWGPIEIGDLTNENELEKLFKKYNFIGVIHLAALSDVESSNLNPDKYYKNNVVGSLNLLQKMIKYNIKNIVFSSSAAVYGNPFYTPIDEEHSKLPINPYGDTKLTVEKLIYNFSNAFNINFISLRYFNVSGSIYESNIGEAHKPETHIIPLALDSAYKNSCFKIFGADYQTNDGTCIRDFVHIKDLSNAHLLSFKKLLSSEINEFINIGGGSGLSVLEVLKCVKKITNLEFSIEICGRRVGDPDVLVSKIHKSKEILMWEPKYSDINSIIFDSWEWYKKYKKFNF